MYNVQCTYMFIYIFTKNYIKMFVWTYIAIEIWHYELYTTNDMDSSTSSPIGRYQVLFHLPFIYYSHLSYTSIGIYQLIYINVAYTPIYTDSFMQIYMKIISII